MKNHLVTGKPLVWARDFAILGGAMGAAAPFFVIFDPTFAAVASLAGALSGGLLGATLCVLLARVRGRLPLSLLLGLSLPLGALWGGFAGLAGGLCATHTVGWYAPSFGATFGGISGLLTLAGFMPLYLLASVNRMPTALLVTACVLMSPAMGWGANLAQLLFGMGGWTLLLPLALTGVWIEQQVRRTRALANASPDLRWQHPEPPNPRAPNLL